MTPRRPRTRPAPPRRRTAAVRRSLAALSALGAVASFVAPAPADAGTPLPFSAEWTREIEDTFFDGTGPLSLEKYARYRAGIERRRDELAAVLTASYRERGTKKRKIAERLGRKKVMRVYGLLLGDPGRFGLLDQLWDEPDPTQARLLASDILEIDYALKVEGTAPLSLRLVDYLSWASIRHWIIEPRSSQDDITREASNLWNPERGDFYSHDELRALLAAGGDLSALDPPPGAGFWQQKEAIGLRDVRQAFYGGDMPVHRGRRAWFPDGRAELTSIRKSQTKPKFELEVKARGTRIGFKLKVGGEIHSEPTVNALLAVLGFNADFTRYVKDFRLDLGKVDLARLRQEWRAYFEAHRTQLSYSFDDYFIEGEDEDGPFLIVREGVLEWKPRDLVRIGPWPSGANGNEGRREARALGLFSAWVGNTDLKEAENNKLMVESPIPLRPQLYHVHHDLGHSLGRMISEQLDAFPWDLVERTPTGRIYLNYHSVQPTSLRTAITYADARWAARLIAQLTRRQIAQAVAIGHWPRAAGALLTEKLVHRRNQLVEAFALEGTPSPSGRIRMLPVDRYVTTDDGAVVDGEFIDGEFEFSTQEFANYWEELLSPALERGGLFLLGQVQRGVGQVPELVFDPRSVGLVRGLVAELLVNFKRQVEENRNPSHAEDYYITRDTFLLGARVGGGIVGRGEVAYLRKYTLVTTSGTEDEARFAEDTILDLLLPYDVYQDDLPDEYVLIREDFLEGRGRAITDDLSGGSVPVGAEATLARVRLARDVVSVRDGRVRAYHDLSVFDQTAFRAFAKAVFVRIPLLRTFDRRGTRRGDFYSLDRAYDQFPEAAQEAISAFIRTGDVRGLDAVTDRTAIDTTYHYQRSWAGLLDLVWRETGASEEVVRVSDPLDQLHVAEAFDQIRVYGKNYWSLLDFIESWRYAVRTIAPSRLTREPRTPVVTVRYVDNDRNTRSDELDDGYIAFINAVGSAGDGRKKHRDRIEFTPSLHSVNDRWGHLYSTVDVGFAPEAVDRLLELDPDAFWHELARQNDVDAGLLLERDPLLLRASKQGMMRRRTLSLADRRALRRARAPIRRSSETLGHLADARTSEDVERRYRAFAEALASASFRRADGFDPRVLTVLRTLAGSDDVSVDARIHPPAWIENRLVGKTPLVLHTHKKPFRLERRPILFQPTDAEQIHGMLDSFESIEPALEREPLELDEEIFDD